MRIASLLASATEMIYGLGLEDHLVAISHECDYPPAALAKPRISRPRFETAGLDSAEIDRALRRAMAEYGSAYVLDEEQLAALEPDVLLAQAVCEVCAVPTTLAERAAAVLPRPPRIVSLDCHTIGDILLGIRRIAAVAGRPERGEAYVAALAERLRRVEEAVAGRPRPRVLAIEWLAPPFVPGHWTPEMVARAGGELLIGAPGRPSRQVTWADLAAHDPDVLIVMPCGYDLEAARRDANRHAAELAAAVPRAIAQRRAFVVNGSAYFNRSGPRVVDGVEILAALLHPECFPDADLMGRAAAWSPPAAIPG